MPRKTDRIRRFTKTIVDALPLPAKGRVDWWDEDVKQLCVRVSSTGAKTFAWMGYDGKTFKRVTIGSFPDMAVALARDEARALTGKAALGQRLTTRRGTATQIWTLGELWEWYFENHAKPHKKTWKEDQRRWELKLQHWAGRRVTDITRSDVQDLHRKQGESSGHYAANKILELLKTMYRLGAEINPERVPCLPPTVAVKRFKTVDRERILDDDELQRFFDGLKALQNETTRDAIEMCLWTGARRSNVFSMRWDEVSFASKTWIIPREKFKSGKPLNIPLLEPALEILNRRKIGSESQFVFPGRGQSGHFKWPREAMAAIRENAALQNFRLHDVRRTLGSRVATIAPNTVVQKMLGHESINSTRVYTRIAQQGVAAAMKAAIDTMKPKRKAAKNKR